MNLLYYLITISVISINCSENKKEGQENNYDKLFIEAQELFQKGDNVEANKIFMSLIKLDSSRVEGYYGAGVTYSKACDTENKNCDEAIILLTLAINIDSTFRRSYYNRGVCYFKRGLFKLALEDYTNTILKDSNDASAFYNRSLAHLNMGDTLNACIDYKKCNSMGITLNQENFQKICD